MTLIRTTAITDAAHAVSYVDAGGVARSIPRTIETRIFAPDTPGNYPVILYSHGLGGSPFANAGNVAASLADLGYIVIAPTHLDSFRTPAEIQDDVYGLVGRAAVHRVADMQFLLTQALAVTAGLAGYSLNLADPTIAGHSLGAFTSALLTGVTSSLPELANLAAGNPYGLGALADPRFRQAILLSPQGEGSGGGNPFGLDNHSWDQQGVPALTLTGTLDSGTDGQTYHDRLQGFDAGPATGRHAFVITGADHGQIGGAAGNPAVSAEVTRAASLFLQAYVGNSATALASLADVAGYTLQHGLVSEAYVRAGLAGSGVLNGSPGNDSLLGLASNDDMRGNDGSDSLGGGAGDDTLSGGNAADTLDGGAGNDTASYRMDAAAGGTSGVYVALAANVAIDGFGAVDSLSSIEIVLGTDSPYNGLPGWSDFLIGGGGGETLLGFGGNDYLDLGGGHDLGQGGDGNDYLFGQSGNDTLGGGSGNDYLDGADGDDLVSGEAGDDYVFGFFGNDVLLGGDGSDFIIAGTGSDVIDGGTGNDYVYYTAADLAAGDFDTIAAMEAGDYVILPAALQGATGVIDHAGGALIYIALPGGNCYLFVSGQTAAFTEAHMLFG